MRWFFKFVPTAVHFLSVVLSNIISIKNISSESESSWNMPIWIFALAMVCSIPLTSFPYHSWLSLRLYWIFSTFFEYSITYVSGNLSGIFVVNSCHGYILASLWVCWSIYIEGNLFLSPLQHLSLFFPKWFASYKRVIELFLICVLKIFYSTIKKKNCTIADGDDPFCGSLYESESFSSPSSI